MPTQGDFTGMSAIEVAGNWAAADPATDWAIVTIVIAD